MIEVFGRATSSNVQAVMWAIAELGLEHRRHDRGHVHGGLDTPEYLAMNPHGLVPVIRDGGGAPIWESGAILRYLADVYGDDAFWPRDPARRAQVDMWAEWAKVAVQRAFTVPVFWAVVRTAPSRQDPAAIQAAIRALDQQLEKADAQLSKAAFLAGAHFTLADIQLGHLLYRYFDMDVPRPDLPNLRAYYDRLTGREAYREHVMISYESLRVPDP